METTPPNNNKVSDLRTKLDEIDTMDQSKMTVLEKKKLRREITYIKERIKKLGGNIYVAIAKLLIITLMIYFLLSVLG